jgi:riboflavin-specific deaminase-like protein
VELTQLFPEPARTSVDALLDGLRLHEYAHDDRPYLVMNFVASLDGRGTIGGRVGALTGPADQRIVYRLRAQAEALLVGAGTVRNERYGRLFPDVAPGQPQPLVVIVTRRIDLPPDLPLLNEPDARIVIGTSSEGTLDCDHAASVEYLRVPPLDGRADVAAILRALRHDYGIRSVVCEGGPTLNEALLAEALVDELFLSLSPLIVGGAERMMADAAPSHATRRARLLAVSTADDYLFLRYAL